MLFDDTYRTITGRSEGVYKDRGSKFIGIALPVRTEEEIKEKLNDIKTEFHDARHHCFAYMLGSDKSASRFNDDGEPSGTAGRPILGQINSHDLTDVLIVVVRYFGGTKLGVRGLINAYKSSALEAITAARIINKTVNEIYAVFFEYASMNQVMQILKDPDIKITAQDFNMKSYLEYKVRKNSADAVREKLNKINRLEVRYLRSD